MTFVTFRASLERDGACRLPAVVGEGQLRTLEAMLPAVMRGGVRLAGMPQMARWIVEQMLPPLVTAGLASVLKPVRAILFDKRADANWALGWHQDRTVAVRERQVANGYGPWSVKQGLLHVEPPFAVTETMHTVRLHLDLVDGANAPLEVALGSHRLGPIRDGEAASVAADLPTMACLADRGDLWVYATAILHASAARIAGPALRRRVLQVDFSSQKLPGGLEWLGVH